MPNFENYVGNTISTSARYTVNRAVSLPNTTLAEIQLPVIPNINDILSIELNFYRSGTSQLVYSRVVPGNIGGVDAYWIKYNDDTIRSFLLIDFTALVNSSQVPVLIPGQYELVVNVFVNEVGTAEVKPLQLEVISPSRTELEFSVYNATGLPEFVETQINSQWIRESTQQLFNQTASVITNIPGNNIYNSVPEILSQLSPAQRNNILVLGAEDELIFSTQLLLDASYAIATEKIQTELDSGTHRFTKSLLETIMADSITSASLQISWPTVDTFTIE